MFFLNVLFFLYVRKSDMWFAIHAWYVNCRMSFLEKKLIYWQQCLSLRVCYDNILETNIIFGQGNKLLLENKVMNFFLLFFHPFIIAFGLVTIFFAVINFFFFNIKTSQGTAIRNVRLLESGVKNNQKLPLMSTNSKLYLLSSFSCDCKDLRH